MPGSRTQADARWPRALELAGRALLSTVLVLIVVQALGRSLVRPLIPVFRTAVPFLDPRFVITDVRLTRLGASEVVRFRGNLSQPVLIDGRIINPFGWNGMPAGGFQITYTVGGVLEYGALLVIFVLAWPASRVSELTCRLALSLPCIALLSLAIVPFTVVAGLHNCLESLLESSPTGALLIASRYLMGGGGFAIALVAAVLCIECARQLVDSRVTPRYGPLADSAEPHVIHETHEDDRTEEGHGDRRHAGVAPIRRSGKERLQEPLRQQRPEDPRRRAQYHTPLGLGSHDRAAEVTNDDSEGQPDKKEAHSRPRSGFPAAYEGIPPP